MKEYPKAMERISVEMVRNMLTFLGYQANQGLGHDNHIEQYFTPDRQDAVILPIRVADIDYKRNLFELLQSVAKNVGDTVEGLLLKLLNPAYDVLKWRISDEEADTGKVSLLSMSENLTLIKELLSVSCLDVINPQQKFHRKLKVKKVNEAIQQYKFGQTEYGSFLINILCPLGDYNYALFGMQEMPLLRKVNLHLLDAYDDIQTSIAGRNRNKVDEDVDAGVYSVNLLDAMTGIYKLSTGKNMSFRVDWSDSVPFNDARKERIISINTDCIGVVEEIANKYRPKEDAAQYRELIGKVEYLGSEAEKENRMTIDAKVVVIGDDNKAMKVNTTLDYAQYGQVVQDAFEEGLTVKVCGTLYLQSSKKVLRNATIEIIQ